MTNEAGRGHLSPFGRGADHALGQRARAARPVDERLADLQRPSRALSRLEVRLRRSDPGDGRGGARTASRRASPRSSATHFDTTGVFGLERRCRRRLREPRLSVVGDAARLSRPRHGPALAFLLRLALPVQRARLSRSGASAAAISGAISRPRAKSSSISAPRSASMRGSGSRRRGGQALQRAAEARLSRRRAGASAADAADRARHVARHGRGLSRLCSKSSAAGRRRAPSISSPRAASCSSSSCISSWC